MISLFIPYKVQASSPQYSPSRYGLPETIAGHKTLAVFTSEDTMCMKAGFKHLVLQATEQDVDTYLLNSQPKEIRAALEQQLAITTSPGQAAKDIANWHVEMVGPGVTLDGVVSEHQKWNEDTRATGCQTLRPTMPTGSDWTEIKSNQHPWPGYAEFEDTDAGTYTDDNAQSVYLPAPSIPNSNGKFSLLNNVATDSSTFYLLQNGFLISGGVGHVTWTDTTHSYVAQYYSMSYISGDTYYVTITYTSGVWQMCARDNAIPSTYTCVIENNGVGTTLQAGTNTSIWFENYATSSSWYQGWPSQLQVYNAKIYRNGVRLDWSTNHRHTIDSCSTNYPAANALSGSLVSAGNGYFILSGAPLDC